MDRNTRAVVVTGAGSVLGRVENDVDLTVGGRVAEGEPICIPVDGENGIGVYAPIGVSVKLNRDVI